MTMINPFTLSPMTLAAGGARFLSLGEKLGVITAGAPLVDVGYQLKTSPETILGPMLAATALFRHPIGPYGRAISQSSSSTRGYDRPGISSHAENAAALLEQGAKFLGEKNPAVSWAELEKIFRRYQDTYKLNHRALADVAGRLAHMGLMTLAEVAFEEAVHATDRRHSLNHYHNATTRRFMLSEVALEAHQAGRKETAARLFEEALSLPVPFESENALVYLLRNYRITGHLIKAGYGEKAHRILHEDIELADHFAGSRVSFDDSCDCQLTLIGQLIRAGDLGEATKYLSRIIRRMPAGEDNQWIYDRILNIIGGCGKKSLIPILGLERRISPEIREKYARMGLF